MNTAEQPLMYEWNRVPWKKVERTVFKLQKRIYQAQKRGDERKVRKLQRLLTRSWYAKLLAVRRVTQENQGKKTAGIDGIKSLNAKQRMELAKDLRLEQKAKAIRRVYIPKPGTEEQRALGIPTIGERAVQALVKAALEPQWEARFEPNSYGFRPGRSVHDAIEQIFNNLRTPKWTLDGDIAKCFDKIAHGPLLAKLDTTKPIRQQIKAWLKSGVVDKWELFPTKEGTPQGGIISPLLANIALHGMEEAIKHITISKGGKKIYPRLIRYADDFVVLHESKEVIEKCKMELGKWLQEKGLEIKESKTRITHTLEKEGEKEAGFEFLGFNIKHVGAGRSDGIKTTQGEGKRYKPRITPSKKAEKSHYEKIKAIIRSHRNKSLMELIKLLNPIIVGWTRFHSTVVSKAKFARMEHLTFKEVIRWARRKHRQKSYQWIYGKYIEGRSKIRTPDKKGWLSRHSRTPIRRHVKVKGQKSPYDGDWVYWSKRMGRYPIISKKVAKLLKRQKGKCSECELYFTMEEKMEIDHIIPIRVGGLDIERNQQLLHLHCHDKKSAKETNAS